MSQQIEELQRSLTAIKSQLASQQRQHAAQQGPPTDDSRQPDLASVEEQRAADAERRRTYMAGVSEAFNNEKINPAWANQASARVGAMLEGDEALRGIVHTVECRQQTCRVQIDDGGSGTLSSRMPYLALGVADVLPSIAAERIEQGNGHNATVLYMSSQQPSADASPKR